MSSLYSFEISGSLKQCRQMYAFNSALCLHGFCGLQTIAGFPFQIHLLSVCHVLGVRELEIMGL